ncbi:Protein cps3 [Rhizoctonia solani]|uniref:Protein cps3 n=1 Tax=Rhizoctonia solani TaxID=456999 RepID=A0A0K6G650_9AGAM|nr:Protein cps3 [Rhizoctonia solani]
MPTPTPTNKPEESAAEKDKAGKGKGPAKSKDLSHVPCKFFRVGGCTAGPACPFSHHVAEPGEGKSVCTWFVKGSCKFGHKCALAHILPGQPMSMDKRNKRAAQAAAGKGGEKSGENKTGDKASTSQSRERNRRTGPDGEHGAKSRERKGTLLGTPPPGIGIGSKAPISISKATPTPATLSGPAITDEFDELTATPRQPPPRQFSPVAPVAASLAEPNNSQSTGLNGAQSAAIPTEPPRRPSPLPPSRPPGISSGRLSRNNDYGPVGSPPAASPGKAGFVTGHTTRPSINGFVSTSPPVRGENPAAFGSSPFSAPGSKSFYLSYSLDQHDAGRQAAPFDPKWDKQRTIKPRDLDNAVDDEDLEEFLPSSLTDLLSPGERERRMSRTRHGARPSVDNHLFSRSVPSSNMLDLKSIWDEQNKPRGRDADPSLPPNPQMRGTSQGRYPEDTRSTSSSLMGTSNISAGFLGQRSSGAPAGMRPVVAQSYDNSAPAVPDFTLSASIDPVSTLGAMQSRPIPGVQKADLSSALSPSTRALRDHAPGQSLPQGLAAGLSRLHLVPAASPNGQWSPDGPRLGSTPRAYDPFGFEDPPRPTFSTLNNLSNPSFGLPMSCTPSSSSNVAPSPPANQRLHTGNTWAHPKATNDDEELFAMDEALE